MEGVMQLSKILIANYRSIKTIEVPLQKFSIMVGYNNAGKSNILHAIQWLLNPNALADKDFNDHEKDIVVCALIEGIDNLVISKIADEHKKKIEPYIVDQKMFIKRVMDHNNLGKKGISLFVSKDINKEFAEAEWVKNPTGIDQAISYLFPDSIELPAMSDAFEDSTKYTAKTTMCQLVGKIIEEFKKNNQETINHSLTAIRSLVCIDGDNRSDELEKVDKLVSRNIADIFPGIDVKLHINLPTIDDLFKGATFKTIEDGHQRDIDSLGHGTQRSIQMALIRSLSEIADVSDDSSSVTTVLIEEPELYLHPYAIELTRQALRALSKSRYQVIVVTHSPLIITEEDMPSTVMIRKESGLGTYRLNTIEENVRKNISDLPSQSEVIYSLSNKTNILFAEKVLLVEGKTEYRVLPAIFEGMKNCTIASKAIALVPQNGVDNTTKSLKILSDLGLKSCALSDLDFAFRGAIQNGFIDDSDTDIGKLKEYLIEIAPQKNIVLDNQNLPRSGNDQSASDGYRILAEDPRTTKHIKSIQEKLKQHGIWIWPKGSIEEHLGISGKKEAIWANLLKQIKEKGATSSITDVKEFEQLIEWFLK
jgi:putative ATP-dependent endonuclease of the OLD family